jgi:hypothetical protein
VWMARARERGGCCEYWACLDVETMTNFPQIHRLPFRRSHRPTMLPTRVQRVGVRCEAISDGCVAVLEDYRRLLKLQCLTLHATTK